MAFSTPLSDSMEKKGQIALLCQLCEKDPQLKWKCLNCELLMCQRCRDKVHNKIASAEDHSIIDIKEISEYHTDLELKPDLTRIKCEYHDDKTCCLFCRTCQELVCQTCIAKTHIKHDFCEISEKYEANLQKVKIRRKDIDTELQNISVSEKMLVQIKATELLKYDTVKHEILHDKEALVSEIKKHTNKLLKELDQKWDFFSNKIENDEKHLKGKQTQIKEEKQNMINSMKASKPKDLWFVTNALLQSSEGNEFPKQTTIEGVPKFTHGDKTKISNILGKFEDDTVQYTVEPEFGKMYVSELEAIKCVVSCPDGFLWICDIRGKTIQKVKPNNDNLSMISKIEIGIYDTALLPCGDLLLCDGSSSLNLIPSDSTDIQESMYTVSPLQSTAVHVTGCGNNVIVGAIGGESVFPATGPRQVMVMDQAGHHEKAFQYVGHNEPLFTYPYRTTSNRQGNIAVVDFVSDNKTGRIVVLNQEGKVRNIYTGNPDVYNEDNPLRPRDITTTPSDNFVVADVYNNTLHVLNSEGDIIKIYNTEEMGILYPLSLSFFTTGQLCIGCDKNKNSKEKAKLFVVNNFLY